MLRPGGPAIGSNVDVSPGTPNRPVLSGWVTARLGSQRSPEMISTRMVASPSCRRVPLESAVDTFGRRRRPSASVPLADARSVTTSRPLVSVSMSACVRDTSRSALGTSSEACPSTRSGLRPRSTGTTVQIVSSGSRWITTIRRSSVWTTVASDTSSGAARRAASDRVGMDGTADGAGSTTGGTGSSTAGTGSTTGGTAEGSACSGAGGTGTGGLGSALGADGAGCNCGGCRTPSSSAGGDPGLRVGSEPAPAGCASASEEAAGSGTVSVRSAAGSTIQTASPLPSAMNPGSDSGVVDSAA